MSVDLPPFGKTDYKHKSFYDLRKLRHANMKHTHDFLFGILSFTFESVSSTWCLLLLA